MILNNSVGQLIKNSLIKSYTYSQYRDLMAQMLIQGMSTGHQQSEALTHYSILNQVRMNRLDRTLTIPVKIENKFQNLKNKYIFLVFTESWCGDAAQTMPVINKIALLKGFDYRVILRDDNEELMSHFLTNGSKSIPKLLILDAETQDFIASWGPRPEDAVQLVNDLKVKYGSFTDEAKTELQKWYLYDKGISTMLEIYDILQKAENREE